MDTTALVRKGIKLAALPAGLLTPTQAGDMTILLFHRIGGRTGSEIDMPRQEFERQLAELEMLPMHVTTLDDALAPTSRGGVVVTFDDGYADFYDEALTLLVEFRIKALLYLATSLVVEEGNRETGTDRGLTWSQIREAFSTGFVEVGSHTHSHMDLARVDVMTATEEMERSKELIEDHLGVACRHFAYPWAVGGEESDRAARASFDSAALGWHTNRRGRIDPYRLGRTPVLRSDSPLFFRAKCRGRLDREAVAYRALRRGPWRKR